MDGWIIIKQTNLSLTLTLTLSCCSIHNDVYIGLYFRHCLNRIIIAFLIAMIRYNNITILGNAYVLRATIESPLWLGSLSLLIWMVAAVVVVMVVVVVALAMGMVVQQQMLQSTNTRIRKTHTHAIHNTPWDRLTVEYMSICRLCVCVCVSVYPTIINQNDYYFSVYTGNEIFVRHYSH